MRVSISITQSVLVVTDLYAGLVYKKGKFSAIEEKQLHDAIENYRAVSQHMDLIMNKTTYPTVKAKGLTPAQITDLIFAKNDKKDNDFWSEISKASPIRIKRLPYWMLNAYIAMQVPQRPIIAVYHHVRRSYHPMKQQGKWMESEDASLLQSVSNKVLRLILALMTLPCYRQSCSRSRTGLGESQCSCWTYVG